MNRRTLFGVIALSPLMAVAAFAKEEVKEDRSKQEPGKGSTSLTLTSSKEVPPITKEIEDLKKARWYVGQDGKLWLKTKTDNEWKRIVTE
jgi:hypothetical protein